MQAVPNSNVVILLETLRHSSVVSNLSLGLKKVGYAFAKLEKVPNPEVKISVFPFVLLISKVFIRK